MEFRLLLCQEKKKWEKQEVTDDHRYPSTSKGLKKLVLSLLTLINVGLVTRFLKIFDKQYPLPLSPWEMHLLLGRVCFCKIQIVNRILLMISMSICEAKQKVLASRTWKQSRLASGEEVKSEHFTLLQKKFILTGP